MSTILDLYLADPAPPRIRVLDDLIKLARRPCPQGGCRCDGLRHPGDRHRRLGREERHAQEHARRGGQLGTGWSVRKHRLPEIAATEEFASYHRMQRPSSAICAACPDLRGLRRRHARPPLERRARARQPDGVLRGPEAAHRQRSRAPAPAHERRRMTPKTAGMQAGHLPFPHASVPALLTAGDADAVLAWLATDAPVEASRRELLRAVRVQPARRHAARRPRDPDGHRLRRRHARPAGPWRRSSRGPRPGRRQRPQAGRRADDPGPQRLHRRAESRRVLLQLDHGWSVDNGGLLMLFADDQPESVTTAILPSHASAFAFEISARSYHAVSTIRAGERYTLVYTFRAA
ncbi:2OG-Fe(II) oxygenase family protein [Sphingomonas sp. MMS24-JH45]